MFTPQFIGKTQFIYMSFMYSLLQEKTYFSHSTCGIVDPVRSLAQVISLYAGRDGPGDEVTIIQDGGQFIGEDRSRVTPL